MREGLPKIPDQRSQERRSDLPKSFMSGSAKLNSPRKIQPAAPSRDAEGIQPEP